jgi:hypothetical protein
MQVRLRFAFSASLLLLFLPAAASAGGNARVVEDAHVAPAGSCQFESWVTAGRGLALVHAAPACAPRRLPGAELGVFLQYSREAGEEEMLVGPTAKLALRSEERGGPAVALAVAAAYSLEDDRLAEASIVVPVTFDLAARTRASVNAGWGWTRGPLANEAIAGIQIEHEAGERLALVGEAFAGTSGSFGWQAGARWTAGRGSPEFDLLLRRDREARPTYAVSLGVTVRN